jgi:polyisoprenoid-binding protein YceI
MKTLLILAFTLLSNSLFAHETETESAKKAQKWNFDKAHSSVSFRIRHFFTPVLGEFNTYDGDIFFDPNNLNESSISVSIQVNSVDTKNGKRDPHLQSADFFDAATYPTMTFVSEKITSLGDNQFVAKGKLTIKDVTTDFELPFKLLGMMDHPMRKGTKIAAFESNFMIKRNDYKVGTGQYVETAVIGEEVNVNITLELLSSN